MHTALQAPSPTADPTPVRSRWMPRLPLSEHPLALTLLVVLATLAIAQLLTPAPARADLPVISPLGGGGTGLLGGATGPLGGGVTGLLGGVANDIFVKGFGTLLQFIFGKALTDLAQSFLKDLLDVTPLSGPKAPPGSASCTTRSRAPAGDFSRSASPRPRSAIGSPATPLAARSRPPPRSPARSARLAS